MTFTYSPCINCRRVNHVCIDPSNLDLKLCKSCHADLPLSGRINNLDGALLATLARRCPMPVVACFTERRSTRKARAALREFDELSVTLAGEAVFARLDLDAHPLCAGFFRITEAPTFVLYLGGHERGRIGAGKIAGAVERWLLSWIGLAAA